MGSCRNTSIFLILNYKICDDFTSFKDASTKNINEFWMFMNFLHVKYFVDDSFSELSEKALSKGLKTETVEKQ